MNPISVAEFRRLLPFGTKLTLTHSTSYHRFLNVPRNVVENNPRCLALLVEGDKESSELPLKGLIVHHDGNGLFKIFRKECTALILTYKVEP